MPEIQIRPFARADRDQLTHLVNAHLSAVAPAASVSVQSLLSSLEREPGEFLVDPWVSERRTLVAEQRQRIVAAAHLLRYAADDRVGEHYRDTAEIRWFVSWTAAPFWPDAPAAADALMATCLRQLDAWQVRRSYADGSLPGPGVYGVPAQWPHIADLYQRAGFTGGRQEDVLVTTTARLRGALPPLEPDPPLDLDRTLGVNGTRFTARRDGRQLGYLEIDTTLGEAGRFSRGAGWADVGNLFVEPGHRRQGVASRLLGRAADWLDLGGVSRLLAYADADSTADGEAAFYRARGFELLTTTRRMLQRG